MRKIYFLASLLLAIIFSDCSFGQIVVTPNNNGNQLAQALAGAGVVVSNVTINCPGTSSGTFVCQNCNCGIGQGIALTTGDINLIPGPNNTGSAGLDNV